MDSLAVKDILKSFGRGFVLLFALSAVIVGLVSCSDGGQPEEYLSSELVKLRVFSKKTDGGAFRFVEYAGDREPGGLIIRTTFRIEGFERIYREGTEYLISARKYTNKKTGAISYNYIETVSESSPH